MVAFAEEINKRVATGNSYIDSIIEYSNENDIEIEVLASLINLNMVEKIEQEAENLNLIEKRETVRLEYDW